jgi:hypothetical protein
VGAGGDQGPGGAADHQFPTLALAELMSNHKSCNLQWERAEIRDRAALLITNPDMLHCSVLPVHRTFARLLSNLRYVVVDEGHAYRCLLALEGACFV